MSVSEGPGPAPSASSVRIGQWTVERDLNQLSSAGQAVKIEPKAMEVLMRLADAPGQVVSRSALLSAVWPDTVVGDDCLTQVVVKLRKVLRDTPDQPTYIETISKRGYRLVAPVGQGAQPDVATPSAAGTPPAPARRSRRTSWISGAGLVAASLAATALWRIADAPPDGEPLHRPSIAITAAARAEGPTVAIRPFEALSNDPEEALLAQGITADLTTDLSRVFGLWVVGAPRSGDKAGAETVPDQDPVQYLVSGTVQRLDKRLRLHVHLSEAGTGKLLWSERFDRDLSDLFAVQDELGPKILHLLPAKVSEAEMQRVSRRYTRTVDAYRQFLRAQAALLARQASENRIARASFQRAIDLDADFARAYAGLALTYAADYRNQWTSDGSAALHRAFEIANSAAQMDPDIPETHWVLAFVHMERRQHRMALREVETAIRLNPSYADGYGLIGSIETYLGRPADALRDLRTAARLEPQVGHLHLMNLGRAQFFLGQLEQARASLERALARNLANLEAHVYLAALHVMRGDAAAAGWEAMEIRSLRPNFTGREWLRTYPMTDRAQRDQLVEALATLGL